MATEADLTIFRDRVKDALSARSMTQKAFEESIGLTGGTLTRLFGGRKKIDEETLVAIAAGLDVAVEELLEGTDLAAELDLSDDIDLGSPEITMETEPEAPPAPARAEPPADDVTLPAPEPARAEPPADDVTLPEPEPEPARAEPPADDVTLPEPEPVEDPPPEPASRLRSLPVVGAIVGGVIAAGAVVAKLIRRDK